MFTKRMSLPVAATGERAGDNIYEASFSADGSDRGAASLRAGSSSCFGLAAPNGFGFAERL